MRIVKILFSVLFVLSVIITVYIKVSDKTDYNPPEIVCDSDTLLVSVNSTDKDILSHVTATDEKDGDLTKNVVIESVSPFIGENNARIIFAVCDSDNNVSKLETNIEYTDYVNPDFDFANQHVYYVGATKIDLMSGVSAEDVLDGDISNRIVVADSKVDLSQPGIYPVKYKVTTSKGVTSEIEVNAYVYASRLKFNIELSDYLVYASEDSQIDPEAYIVDYPEDYFTGRIRDNYEYSFDIINDVDYTVPGVYYITYRMSRVYDYDDSEEPEILAEAYLAVAVRGD